MNSQLTTSTHCRGRVWSINNIQYHCATLASAAHIGTSHVGHGAPTRTRQNISNPFARPSIIFALLFDPSMRLLQAEPRCRSLGEPRRQARRPSPFRAGRVLGPHFERIHCRTAIMMTSHRSSNFVFFRSRGTAANGRPSLLYRFGTSPRCRRLQHSHRPYHLGKATTSRMLPTPPR